MPIRLLAALALLFPAVALAQETRPLPEDYTPPPASIADFAWMIGHWEGEGIGGARAVESWLPPVENTMVGTFIQAADAGGIEFSEHIYLIEEEGSVVMHLKHFNADLTGWEEKDDVTSFRLIEVEHCAAWFGGLTLRCDGEDGYLAAVRVRSSDGEIGELVFRFKRAD